MKTDFVEIETLIKLLESNDVDEVKIASSKLKMNFRNKMDELKLRESHVKNEDLDALFNRIIFYIYSQSEDQKRILINKLAWSLSNENGSLDLFEDLLNFINNQT
ncbi:MAG: hypothetical protein NKF70_02980 [Methanobacterium sp. ERen5]|nr:MAG: hypothetical protein NKF70_02980 [Methanobacterium sp. ERen5]